jgi:small-conductance mechanosensitive channel
MRWAGFKDLTAAALLTALVAFLPSALRAAPEAAVVPPVEAEGTPPAAPDLADIIPMASDLAGRVTLLENSIKGGPNTVEFESRYEGVEKSLEEIAAQIKPLKDSEGYKYNKLVALKDGIKNNDELLKEISRPVNRSVSQLGAWREEWLAEKERWGEWQVTLLEDDELDRLKSTFSEAKGTIDKALDLIQSRLDLLLAVQQRAANVKGKISALNVELDALLVVERRSTLLDETPPMLSTDYFSQIRNRALGHALREGLDGASWPDDQFFTRQGWIVFIQGLLVLILTLAFSRNRGVLLESERWRFLAQRPLSAGLFLGFVATLFLYEYEGAPATWKLANTIIGGVSFARLMGCLLEESWKKRFVNGLLVIVIINRFLEAFSFPLPLFRLYTVLAALAGLFFCLNLAKDSSRRKDSKIYTWGLRSGSMFFAVVIFSQLLGRTVLASYLFISFISSTAAVLVFFLFMYMVRGGLEWLFRNSPLRRASVQKSDETDDIIRQLTNFARILIGVLVLIPALLVIWGAYDSLEGATKGLLDLGFNLGDRRLSLGLILAAVGILYGSFLLSWIIQKMLTDELFSSRRVEKGVRASVGRLFHYVILLAGFLLALSILGFEISKLTLMLSALGVGIGFGLQDVVRNFVSGIILLFEQPVRVGDIVEIDGTWSEVKRIGIRSTIVRTFDQSDLIIPNADLVGNKVTNWTLGNRQARLIVPVGIAYGSNVTLAMETLQSAARKNPNILEKPEPRVLFLGFGESSLDMELHVRVRDADHRLQTSSELHQEIDRRFREAGIEISFPQRVVHLHGVDEPDFGDRQEGSDEDHPDS